MTKQYRVHAGSSILLCLPSCRTCGTRMYVCALHNLLPPPCHPSPLSIATQSVRGVKCTDNCRPKQTGKYRSTIYIGERVHVCNSTIQLYTYMYVRISATYGRSKTGSVCVWGPLSLTTPCSSGGC